jgi:glucose-6-phosphate isomerase
LDGDETSVAKHFVAVSTNATEVSKFGIDTANMFEFWDWVGGPLLDGLGNWSFDDGRHRPGATFGAMLDGFHQMDEHFRTAPFRSQSAGADGITGGLVQRILRRTNCRRPPLRTIPEAVPGISAAVDDGEQRKARYARRNRSHTPNRPNLLGRAGNEWAAFVLPVDSPGTRLIPCDFIAFAKSLNPIGPHHDMLLANVFAQTEALAFGKTPEQVKKEGTPDWLVPHRVFEGNRPSKHDSWLSNLRRKRSANSLPFTNTPSSPRESFGTLIRLTSGELNSARSWLSALFQSLRSKTEPALGHDSSTNTLIRRYRKHKEAL